MYKISFNDTQNYLNIYVVQTESDADKYLSVMREKTI